MNNLTKKIIATIIGLSMVVMMAPSLAQALTADELQTQITQLLAQLNLLQTQLATLQGTAAPTVTGCTISSFIRNLTQGMTGDDVKCLQIILNSDSATQVAATGVGSSGAETTYFGALTKAAVVKFQEKYAAEVLTPLGLTAGTGFVGAKTIVKLNSILAVVTPPAGVVCGNGTCETGETTANCLADCPAVAAGLTAALAADTPAAGIIVAGSSIAELAKIKFTNGDATDVKVSTLKLKRIGVSDDSTLPSLYLFDGYNRLGDEGTISSGVVTFNVAGGIFTVPTGGSKTISVRADIADGATGQTVGVKLEAATDITSNASNASLVNGTFPMSGNLMSVTAKPATAGAATLSTTLPAANADIDAVDNFVIWQNTLAATNQNVSFEYLRLTQIGSISASDLANVRLDMSGTEIATGKLVAGTVGQDLVFDLSASPITITKGLTKTLTVYADIVGGASKTMRLSLEKASDIFLKDAAFGCYVSVGAYVPSRTGIQTIKQGTITMTKATDSASGNVVNNSSNVSLAKFNVKANGEEIKINSLQVQISTDSASSTYLRNGFLLLDGVQVGNTQVIATNKGSVTSTSFNIYQKIAAGTTKTLEVKADIYGCVGTTCTANVLAAANTIQAKVLLGADNAQGMSSLNMIDAPGALAPGTSLTVGTGGLTLVVNSAYGDQSVSAGSDTKIGSYNLTAGAYDTINISALTATVTTTDGMALVDLSNLYLVYGSNTTAAKGTVSASNAFSVITSLAPSKTMTINVWATIDSAASGKVKTTLAVTATKATDGTEANAPATAFAQIISTATGALTVALASDAPDAAIVTGLSTDLLLAKFNFSALYETFTVSQTQIGVLSGTEDNFISLYAKYKNAAGETITSDAVPVVSGIANFTGMTLSVPSGGVSAFSVYGNMNAVVAGVGYANSGDRPRLSLVYYKASSGSQPSYVGPSTSEYNNVTLKHVGTSSAAWSTSSATEGSYSAKLVGGATQDGDTYAAVVIPINGSMRLADITSFVFNYTFEATGTTQGGPHMAFYTHNATSGLTGEISLFSGGDPNPTYDGTPANKGLNTVTVSTSTVTSSSTQPSAFFWYGSQTGSGLTKGAGSPLYTLAEFQADVAFANHVIDRIQIEYGWWGSGNAGTSTYVNDGTLNGIPYVIEPMISANQMLLYKTTPTVEVRAGITSGPLVNGVNSLYAATITANAKGDVGVKEITFNVAMGMGSDGDKATAFKFYRGSTDITDKVTITTGSTDLETDTDGLASSTTATVKVTFATEEVITADTSQTYYLKATVTGVSAVGENIQTYILGEANYLAPAAYSADMAKFVWTDKSYPAIAHSETSLDWIGGYLVKTVPTDTYTLSK